jgi:hypothetical protein
MSKTIFWCAGLVAAVSLAGAAEARQASFGSAARQQAGQARAGALQSGFAHLHGRGGRRGFGRFDGFGVGRGYGLGWYGGGLIEDPEALRDQGFFADTGNSWTEHGRAVYDYDRSYPYDWYNDGDAEGPPPRRAANAGPAVRCEISWVADAKGERSAVRICRGRR